MTIHQTCMTTVMWIAPIPVGGVIARQFLSPEAIRNWMGSMITPKKMPRLMNLQEKLKIKRHDLLNPSFIYNGCFRAEVTFR